MLRQTAFLLQEKLTQFKANLVPIYMKLAEARLPIMTINQIKNLEFLKLSHATNRTEFQELIDGLNDTMTNNMEVLIDLVSHSY